jgi:hypothetical protein
MTDPTFLAAVPAKAALARSPGNEIFGGTFTNPACSSSLAVTAFGGLMRVPPMPVR